MIVAEVAMTSHEHEHAGGHTEFTQEFWDDRYRSAGRLWSGQPNHQLVAQAAGLQAGAALDAGCGEGADAIWLASRGWTVTAVDVSQVALDRAAAHAAEQADQVAGRISWRRADLLSWDPAPQRFDLVSVQFMHLPSPELESMHRRLAAAVRPGGTLLIVGHDHNFGSATGRAGPSHLFRPAEQLAAALDPADWDVLVASAVDRPGKDPDGHQVTLKDIVLRAARRGS
jgi:2-polyprenyl-3-methyl-5-hydroxy-6-metoxy-1,4-benzoquinol methylase